MKKKHSNDDNGGGGDVDGEDHGNDNRRKIAKHVLFQKHKSDIYMFI